MICKPLLRTCSFGIPPAFISREPSGKSREWVTSATCTDEACQVLESHRRDNQICTEPSCLESCGAPVYLSTRRAKHDRLSNIGELECCHHQHQHHHHHRRRHHHTHRRRHGHCHHHRRIIIVTIIITIIIIIIIIIILFFILLIFIVNVTNVVPTERFMWLRASCRETQYQRP